MFRTINALLQEATLYTRSIWYRHSLRAVVVAGRYTDCVRTDHQFSHNLCIARAERDGTRAETRFRLSLKRTSHLSRWECQFIRLLAAEVCASA